MRQGTGRSIESIAVLNENIDRVVNCSDCGPHSLQKHVHAVLVISTGWHGSGSKVNDIYFNEKTDHHSVDNMCQQLCVLISQI